MFTLAYAAWLANEDKGKVGLPRAAKEVGQ